MKAIVLAAGYGTRLGLNTPKHLVEVAGKAMINRLLENLDKVDLEHIYIVTNDLGFEATKKAIDRYNYGRFMTVIKDGTTKNDARLGTMGDILFTVNEANIQDDVLIIAGDNLFDFDLHDFVNFFNEKKSDCLVLVDVKDKEAAKKYGIAAIDGNSKIIDFVEKPQDPPSTLAGTLCYLFTKDTLVLLPFYKANGHDMDKAGSFIEYLYKEKSVYGWVTDKTWFDIGDKEQLKKADEYFTKNPYTPKL